MRKPTINITFKVIAITGVLIGLTLLFKPKTKPESKQTPTIDSTKYKQLELKVDNSQVIIDSLQSNIDTLIKHAQTHEQIIERLRSNRRKADPIISAYSSAELERLLAIRYAGDPTQAAGDSAVAGPDSVRF